jgi:hypothetical protein
MGRGTAGVPGCLVENRCDPWHTRPPVAGAAEPTEPEDAMTRHIAERPQQGDDSRLQRYTEIERDGHARDQSVDLQRRPRDARDSGRRTQEYARIERGRDA